MRDTEGLYIACALALGLTLVMCSGCSWLVDFDRFHGARRPSTDASVDAAELEDAHAQNAGVFDGSSAELEDGAPMRPMDASTSRDASMRTDAAPMDAAQDAGKCGAGKREECKADPCATMKQVMTCVRSEGGVCLEYKTMTVCVPGQTCACVAL